MTLFLLWARDRRGSTAAEFAMLLPLILLFLLGIIDAGRYAWEVNRAEKATQIGARWAAVTDLVPSGLAGYSFAVDAGIPAGTQVPASAFPGLSCSSNGTTTSCTCSASCSFPTTANNTAFTAIVNRMNDIQPQIRAANVVVDYKWSGLGFAGDPNGPDVAPVISVRLRNMSFTPLIGILFNAAIALPDASYSLTMEDGSGNRSN